MSETPPRDESPADLGMATTLAVRAGLDALREGNATTALALFDRALILSPGAPEASYRRALALEALGRAPEAAEWARACLEDPTHAAGARALLDRLAAFPRAADDARADDLPEVPPDAGPETVPPRAEPAWAPGAAVEGRWEVFGSAEGGMGRVYFVRDREWGGLEMAVKTLSPRVSAGGAAAERTRAMFRRESQVWLDLGAHPHIVSGYYTLEVQGALRFFMEYVPGMPLDAVLRAAGARLPVAHAIDLAIQLAAGLEYIHARGVVHRDVKPANCLVMEDGTLRLTDFGLGKVAAQAESTEGDGALPALGALGVSVGGAGTPWYMAPEQWRSLAEAREPADVYALGVVLYELLAGAYPFDVDPALLARYAPGLPPALRRVIEAGGCSRELVLWTLHQEVQPLPLRAFAPDAPADVEALATRCLAKSAGDRPAMREVRDALLGAYRAAAGIDYPRELRGALEPTETGETNRAISYFVMGESARAKAILDAWLAREPRALHAWINRRVMAMHSGEQSPQAVALEFARAVAPAHAAALENDRHVASFARALESFAPWTAGPVAAAAIAPGGEALALAVGERVLLERDGVRRWLEGHGAPVAALAFDARGERLASAGHDRTVRVWDARAGEAISVLRAHRGSVLAVALAGDGSAVISAAGGGAGRARAWVSDARTGEARFSLRAHRGGACAVALSPDGALALTAGADGSAALWDAAGGALLYAFEPPEGRVRSRFAPDRGPAVVAVGFDPRGGACMLARRDGRIEWYETRGGRSVAAWGAGRPGLTAARALAGRGVVAGYDDGALRVWDAQGEEVFVARAGPGPVRGVAASADGGVLLACGDEGAQRWWPGTGEGSAGGAGARAPFGLVIRAPLSAPGILQRARERHRLLARLEAGDAGAYGELAALRARTPQYARDEGLIARAERALAGRAARAGLRDAWQVAAWGVAGAPRSLGFSPDGERLFAVVGAPGGARVSQWTRAGGEVAAPAGMIVPALPVGGSSGAMVPSADGRTVLLAPGAGRVVLRRAGDGREIRALDAPGDATALAFGPGGVHAASGHPDGSVRLLDPSGARAARVLRGHRHGVAALAFSADGRWLASGGWDGAARVWEVDAGRCARVLDAPEGGVSVVAFDREALCVLVAGNGGALLFDTRDGRALGALGAGAYTCGAFAPGGEWAALGGWGDAVALFEARGGRRLAALGGHAHGVTAVAFAPDGGALATAGADGTVRVFRLDAEWSPGEVVARAVERALDEGADFDAVLRAWREAQACARALPAERLAALRARVRAAAARASAGGAEFDALADPRERAVRVDPALG